MHCIKLIRLDFRCNDNCFGRWKKKWHSNLRFASAQFQKCDKPQRNSLKPKWNEQLRVIRQVKSNKLSNLMRKSSFVFVTFCGRKSTWGKENQPKRIQQLENIWYLNSHFKIERQQAKRIEPDGFKVTLTKSMALNSQFHRSSPFFLSGQCAYDGTILFLSIFFFFGFSIKCAKTQVRETTKCSSLIKSHLWDK